MWRRSIEGMYRCIRVMRLYTRVQSASGGMIRGKKSIFRFQKKKKGGNEILRGFTGTRVRTAC